MNGEKRVLKMFSVKVRIEYILTLLQPLSLAIVVQSRDKQYVNKLIWLFFNKTLFKDANGGPDVISLATCDSDMK